MATDDTTVTDAVVDFLYETGTLQRTPRSGWSFLLGAPPQSVADHSFRVALLAWVLARLDGGVDADRTLRMALVHDLAETRTGDLNYVHQRYVRADEHRALRDQAAGLPFADELVGLFDEAEARATAEARLVRDADQLEMLLSLREREAGGVSAARDWMDAVESRLESPVARRLAARIRSRDPAAWWFADRDARWWVTGGKHAPSPTPGSDDQRDRS